jgi:hypothetical protein
VRCVHQREADVVIAQELGVGALVSSRQQLEDGSPAQLNAAFASDRPDAVQIPIRAQDTLPDGLREREDAQLEHVPRGVWLRRGEEEQPSCGARSEFCGRGGGYSRDRGLERRRTALTRLLALREHPDAMPPEVLAQELTGEERMVGPCVGLVCQGAIGPHRIPDSGVRAVHLEEALSTHRPHGMVRDVRDPPRRAGLHALAP